MQKTNQTLHTTRPKVPDFGAVLGPPTARIPAVKPLQIIYTQDFLPIKQVHLHKGITQQLERYHHCWILHKEHQIKLELEWIWLGSEHYPILTTPQEQLVYHLPGIRL